MDRQRLVRADDRQVRRNHRDRQAVDVPVRVCLDARHTGDAGQPGIPAQVVPYPDHGQDLGGGADGQALLGLQRRVRVPVVASIEQCPAGLFVHDQDLAVLDDVIAVAAQQFFGPQCGVQVADQPGVSRCVEVIDAE
jgi:hypothetical protein